MPTVSRRLSIAEKQNKLQKLRDSFVGDEVPTEAVLKSIGITVDNWNIHKKHADTFQDRTFQDYDAAKDKVRKIQMSSLRAKLKAKIVAQPHTSAKNLLTFAKRKAQKIDWIDKFVPTLGWVYKFLAKECPKKPHKKFQPLYRWIEKEIAEEGFVDVAKLKRKAVTLVVDGKGKRFSGSKSAVKSLRKRVERHFRLTTTKKQRMVKQA